MQSVFVAGSVCIRRMKTGATGKVLWLAGLVALCAAGCTRDMIALPV